MEVQGVCSTDTMKQGSFFFLLSVRMCLASAVAARLKLFAEVSAAKEGSR